MVYSRLKYLFVLFFNVTEVFINGIAWDKSTCVLFVSSLERTNTPTFTETIRGGFTFAADAVCVAAL